MKLEEEEVIIKFYRALTKLEQLQLYSYLANKVNEKKVIKFARPKNRTCKGRQGD